MLDESEIYIKELSHTIINLYKLAIEDMGYDLGDTNNEIEYRNFLVRDPINYNTKSLNESGFDSNFAAPEGKLPIPQGFYSDAVLYNFLSTAEGNIGVQWVATDHGHDIVRSAACFGYDFPGGVHDPSYIKLLGLTQDDADSLTITKRGRKPIGGEWYGGKVKWGWYTNPIPSDHSYWKKLIPYYRDAMIWAWNQQIIQAVKDPAERLARMHSINWWGHHYLKGFSGGSGWPHRFQAAQQACSGMGRFV
jgi:hypothetical protein